MFGYSPSVSVTFCAVCSVVTLKLECNDWCVLFCWRSPDEYWPVTGMLLIGCLRLSVRRSVMVIQQCFARVTINKYWYEQILCMEKLYLCLRVCMSVCVCSCLCMLLSHLIVHDTQLHPDRWYLYCVIYLVLLCEHIDNLIGVLSSLNPFTVSRARYRMGQIFQLYSILGFITGNRLPEILAHVWPTRFCLSVIVKPGVWCVRHVWA